MKAFSIIIRKAGTTIRLVSKLNIIAIKDKNPNDYISRNGENNKAPKPPAIVNADVVIAFPVLSIDLTTDTIGSNLFISPEYPLQYMD